jgi:hypothetical protein
MSILFQRGFQSDRPCQVSLTAAGVSLLRRLAICAATAEAAGLAPAAEDNAARLVSVHAASRQARPSATYYPSSVHRLSSMANPRPCATESGRAELNRGAPGRGDAALASATADGGGGRLCCGGAFISHPTSHMRLYSSATAIQVRFSRLKEFWD